MSTPATVLDNLSQHLRNSIAFSISLATSYGQPQVYPVMLLYAIAKEKGCVGKEILEKCTITTKTLQDELDQLKKLSTKSSESAVPELHPVSRKALEKAMLTAYEFGHQYVGTEHLVYGILTTKDDDTVSLLRSLHVPIDAIQEQLQQVFSGMTQFPTVDDTPADADALDSLLEQTKQKSKSTKKKTKALDKYTVDLTSKAAQKRLDPVIGRDQEIERIIHILSRRNKNNPILLGEPGVGKTAIVEGLAKRIFEGTVPPILQSRRILALDLPLMISGTIYRGEFESRLKAVMDELADHPNFILFIDELHNIIGAGSNQGTMDAANMLKPALARGEIRCIGATTHDEYQKFILQDPALNRRFQSVQVDEPSADMATHMLDGIKTYYEQYHNVTFQKEAVEAAVSLSVRYIHDNYLPDKALDLLDEAAAAVRVHRPESAKQKKLHHLQKDIATLEEQKEAAIHEERFDEAKELKSLLEKKQTAYESMKKEETPDEPAAKVQASDIVRVLATRLGIHADDIAIDQTKALEQTRAHLLQQVPGQEAAITRIIDQLLESQLGLRPSDVPQASFLFAGAKQSGMHDVTTILASSYFHSSQALIRFDMSEFAEGHAAAKLLGSPAGYVGHNERNHFVDAIRKHPHSVIVFDNLDKAHKDVLTLVEQIVTTGKYTQSNGKVVRFSQAIIIGMISLEEQAFKTTTFGFDTTESSATVSITSDQQQKLLAERLPKSLAGSLDEIVLFPPRSAAAEKQHIVQLLEQTLAAIKAAKSLTITYNKSVIDTLYEAAHKPANASIGIDRYIRRTIASLLIALQKKKQAPRKKQYTLSTSTQTNEIVLK